LGVLPHFGRALKTHPPPRLIQPAICHQASRYRLGVDFAFRHRDQQLGGEGLEVFV